MALCIPVIDYLMYTCNGPRFENVKHTRNSDIEMQQLMRNRNLIIN